MGNEIRPDFYGSIGEEGHDYPNHNSVASATAMPGVVFQRQSSTLSNTSESKKIIEDARINSRMHKRMSLFCLALTYFTVMCAYSMIAPFFPAEGKRKGANGTITGLIFAVFPLTVFFCSPIAGYLIPKLGLKSTLLVGLIIEGSAQIAFGFVDLVPAGTVYIVICFVIRIIMGIGSSASSTASFAILSVTFTENLATSMGILETFGGFGMMAGPPIGGLLYSVGGYKLPFLVLGSVIFVAVFLICISFPSNVKSEPETQHSDVSLWRVLRVPGVMMISILIVIGGMVLTFLDPTLAPHLEVYKLSSSEVGLVFLIAPAMYAIAAPIFGWLADGHDLRLLMTTGAILCGIAYFFLGPFPLLPKASFPRLLWFDCITLGLMGFSIAPMFVPALSDYHLSISNAGLPDSLAVKSIISGIFNSAFNVGGIVGPTVGGALAQYISFGWAVSVFSFILFLLALSLAIFTIIERRHSKSVPSYTGERERLLISGVVA